MSELTTDNFKTILKEELEKGFEEQARFINTAFQEQQDHMDDKFDAVDQRFDKIEERLQIVETKLDRALYTELVHLESRLRTVEEKIGLKPAHA